MIGNRQGEGFELGNNWIFPGTFPGIVQLLHNAYSMWVGGGGGGGGGEERG